MKFAKPLLCVAALAVVAIVSCKKEDEQEEQPPAPDVTAPVLELVGEPTMDAVLNGTWSDPGFSALDDQDGDVTDQVEVAGEVNLDQTGIYELNYTVSDVAGNEATLTREVTVRNDVEFIGGLYTVSASCSGTSWNPDTYTSFITVSETENNRFIISEVYSSHDETAMGVLVERDGDQLVIPDQSAEGVQIEGNGTVGENVFEISLSTGEDCNQTFTKDE